MKRKSLLFLLLLALLAPWTAKATDLTVADASGTLNTVPVYLCFADDNYQRTQTIYPSSMLTQMQGGTITKLTYYLESSVTKSLGSTFQVRLGTTSQSIFSNSSGITYLSDATNLVYSGTLSISGNTVVFTFDTPYSYTGGNLLVDVRITALGSGYTCTSFKGATGTGYYSVQNKSTSSVPTTGTGTDFMPKTTFTYTAASSVCTPTWTGTSNYYISNFKAKIDGASSYQIDNTTTGTQESTSDYYSTYSISAEAGNTILYNTTPNTSSTWRYALWVDWNNDGDFADTDEEIYNSSSYITISEKSFSIPSNTTAGNYRMRVMIDYSGSGSKLQPCGSNVSGEAEDYKLTVTAPDPCDKTIPYTYGFEDASDFSCWTTVDCETDTQQGLSGIVNYVPNTGTYAFWFSSYCGNTDPQYLISPKLTGVMNGVHVEFYYSNLANAPETFQVGYSTTDNNVSSFTWVDSKTSTAETYQHFTANYMGNVKYVAVKYTTADSYYLAIDDFSIEEAPSCLEPTNVTASNETTTSATISWTAGGSETEWDLYYTSNPSDVPSASTTPSISSINTTSQNLTGLNPATTYYVYVRAQCTETSAWSTPGIFNTECNGMTLPYTYGFEDGALSVCWNIINDSQVYMDANVSTSNTYQGSYKLDLRRGTSNGNQIVVLPEVASTYALSNYVVSFYARLYAATEDETTTNRTLAVGVMTDPDDASTFVQVGSAVTPTASYAQYTFDLSSYTGNGHYIAIKHTSTSNGHTFIDNIEVNALPCPVPAGLNASNITAASATLSWTGDQSSYNVRYRSFTAGEATTITESFEGQTAAGYSATGALPNGWNSYSTNDYKPHVSNYSNYSFITNLSGNYLLMTTNGSATGSVYAIMPKYENLTAVSFYYVFESTTSCGTLEVGYVTDNTGYSTFQRLGDAIQPATSWNSNPYTLSSSDISTINSAGGYIAFKYNSNSTTYYSAAIDNVVVTAQSITYGAWNTTNTNVTSPLTITGLTPTTDYEWQVQGVNCDGNGGTTDWSASATFTTDELSTYQITASANPTDGGTVAFMTGAASTSAHTHLPLDSYRDNSFSQQIYTPEEIGGGTINSISLFSVYGNLNDDGINYTRNLDVYLVHTSKTEFSSTSDWIAVTNDDKVFSGNVEFICGEWNTINFTTSFNYNGTSNLALIIADNTSESAEVGNYLECRTFEPSSGVYCSLNDDTQFNPSSPSGNGERLTQKNQILVNGSATRTFPEGATCTLVATANTDYRFVDWTENDEQASTDATYSFTVTGDRNLVANFEPNSHTITIVPNNTEYGSVSQGTVVNVPHNATISTSGNTLTVNGTTVTATPAQATGQYTYTFSDWSNVPATVTEDVTITANFTQTVNNYTVNIEPNDANYGSVSPVSVTSVPYGTTITTSGNTLTVNDITVTATPAQATAQYTYAFSSWSNAPETVTGNVTITANFTQTTKSYNLTLIADPTTGGTVSGGGTYNYGEEVTITATANDGYTFGSWSDNGAQSHTVTITGDATYTATFTQNEYTLTLTADPTEGGMLSASPAQASYHYGDVVEVSATPNDGFIFGSWSDGGAQTHNVTITGDTELIAYFGADHTLTTYVNPIEGGYVTIAENQVSTIGAVEVGDPSDSGVQNVSSPYWTSVYYSFEECLYLASEIGVADGYITSISYYVRSSSSASSQTDDRIEVYMKNTNRTSFSNSNSDIELVTANDKVFDGTWHLTNTTGWVTIVLDKPFHYTGSTLMIGIHEMTQGSSNINFKFTDTQSMMESNHFTCKSVYKNETQGDIDPTALTSLANKINNRANVRLGFGTYHNGQSVTLTAHANEGYQFVNWTENNVEIGTNDTYIVSMTEDRDYTIYANFERLAKRFITAGDWNVANNWSPAGAPDITEDVYIEAAATIPSGCVATANEINITTGSITIADGGQLQHNNTGVSLTAQKEISGYTEPHHETNWNYYLFSSPVDNIAVSHVTGLQTSEHYDLYKFVSNNEESGNLLEWVPVGDNGSLVRNEGYIYASRTDTRIEISGTVLPSDTTISNTLTYNDGYRFGGWNLIGNPFVCNAYVTNANSANIDYYVLYNNDESHYDEFVTASSSDPVAPLSALMVQATAANQSVTYSRTAPGKGAGILNIDVNRTMDRSTTLLDRARVRFGEGEGLQKFQFNPNHTKVYIPEGDKDFAVYYADGAGTIPVNFKAEDNGRYTLDFSTEEIGFNYLHLINNRNGNDVDLLQTPYYAFDAKSTDFASRFTLVFATGSSTGSDTFAFFNNGVWIINNDGKAELQVVDVLGRILSSETISGSCSKAINAAPGVYMLRLINGNDVKVQKVVVRR